MMPRPKVSNVNGSKPWSWNHPFKDKAEKMAAMKAKKAAKAKTYETAVEKQEEAELLRLAEEEEARQSLTHAGDRSYRSLGGDGTFRRAPVRYDE